MLPYLLFALVAGFAAQRYLRWFYETCPTRKEWLLALGTCAILVFVPAVNMVIALCVVCFYLALAIHLIDESAFMNTRVGAKK